MDRLSHQKQKEEELVRRVHDFSATGKAAKTTLETDQKVLARVTDGIYRLPGSALRELISNAYDADAENVIIETDVPRFESMTIRDDGNGMSVETLVNLLNHIGGSAKRNTKGIQLNVTHQTDNTLSRNKGRKLIGKIGIGLFSVAQLTRDFEIVTKEAGKDYYLKASINLHNYSEEYINQIESSEERGASFETGTVEIWTESTDNIDAHGTDIILRNIKKSARDQLRSVDIWGQEDAETNADPDTDEDVLNSSKLTKPTFHVGYLDKKDGYEKFDTVQDRAPNLPWQPQEKTEKKFRILYEEIIALTRKTTNPKLGSVLDNYLHMLWTLSLSVPLNYIEKHPFSYTLNEVKEVFALSNKRKGQAMTIPQEVDKSFSDIFDLKTKTQLNDFNVVVDGIELFRPIKFTDLPKSEAVVKEPLLFLGGYRQAFAELDAKDSGGELSFEAYILWSPKVIPKDHNGVLVRLHDASGILFDETFMRYQVAEHTIKSQLIAEIFVNKGLDSALNIDRESFNISHPHYQVIMTWLHQAMRQVVNKYKSIRNEKLQIRKSEEEKRFSSELEHVTETSIRKRGRDIQSSPNLYLVDAEKAYSSQRGEKEISSLTIEAVQFERKRFRDITGNNTTKKSRSVEAKTDALLKILDSYGMLEDLTPESQESLIEDIITVLNFGE
ncbi:ATP-binding protein [Pseudoalteromonas luteoviolacea]|uniref:Histidine kinase/HSP90-like ATPase domain-containing protein n=1 Tax=Pseudoalteromonas luteoviolacea S4060-1 TaxID=1365257 RepID=A0A167J1A4_9GAMM|nr:ATP-binding protein [Pseudoalteromonas luteoviolacea]KZN60368.1 hypothetical protein N478_07365 [Pseudoalteromonas luteoviolacea S4060-1]